MDKAYNKMDRQSIRLRTYDYSQAASYLFTICTRQGQHLLGNIINNQMYPNPTGQIVLDVWRTLPERYSHVELDLFQLMPNHLHGIITLTTPERPPTSSIPVPHIPQRFQPTTQSSETSKDFPPLGEILRTFKALSTYHIHKNSMPEFAWYQRYYESIITTPKDLARARHYIITNPSKWTKDSLYKDPQS